MVRNACSPTRSAPSGSGRAGCPFTAGSGAWRLRSCSSRAAAARSTPPLPAVVVGTGRIGNFRNGELWGKETDVPWAFVVDGVARHPSQLYEALLEGLVLFVIMWWYTARPRPRLAPTGLFLVCYGVFRFAVEFVRIPDENRGYLALGWVTAGQLLSMPMIVAGVWMLVVAH